MTNKKVKKRSDKDEIITKTKCDFVQILASELGSMQFSLAVATVALRETEELLIRIAERSK